MSLGVAPRRARRQKPRFLPPQMRCGIEKIVSTIFSDGEGLSRGGSPVTCSSFTGVRALCTGMATRQWRTRKAQHRPGAGTRALALAGDSLRERPHFFDSA